MVTFLKSNPFRFKETFYTFNKQKWRHVSRGRKCYGRCWPKLLLVKWTFHYFFSCSRWQKY